MLTYQMTYLEDSERHLLNRASSVNFEVKDLEGRDVAVGRYLGKMAENRNVAKRHYEIAVDWHRGYQQGLADGKGHTCPDNNCCHGSPN